MKLVWSRRAIKNLVAIRDYIAQDSAAHAAGVAAKIAAGTELLELYPNIGRPGRIGGTRELVIPGTPYLVAYRVLGETIDLLAVLHGRQRWPREL